MFEQLENWAGVALASFMFLYTMLRQHLPPQLDGYFTTQLRKINSWIDPYISIHIYVYAGDPKTRSDAYYAVEAYVLAFCAQRGRNLKAVLGKDNLLLLGLFSHDEVTDNFQGAKLWWTYYSPFSQSKSLPPGVDKDRFYKLAFHKRHRDLVMSSYLAHVVKEGRNVIASNRRRKLFTVTPSKKSDLPPAWSHAVFHHPSTFDTLAMAADKKNEIKNDLLAFRQSEEYYSHIGKAWKRGYLLHGPPGTGKSTMVGAMANLLDYDVYDLDLAAVRSDTELRKLFAETNSKSIIVIEDVEKRKSDKEVTVSGLLNLLDGVSSACGGERLVVFTTNHIEKLDPALIRRGRMDKHIENRK